MDGGYLIDNNRIENIIRRKKYLFSGSGLAALLYYVLGISMLCALEPYAYLSNVIARIGEYKVNQLSNLLPLYRQPVAS